MFSFFRLVSLLYVSLILAACGGGGSNNPTSGNNSTEGNNSTDNNDGNAEEGLSFTEFNIATADSPGVLNFSWRAEGKTPAHFQLEVNPDGASGYTPVDTNGDHIITAEDLIPSNVSNINIPIPLHLTDFNNARYRIVGLDEAGNESVASTELGLLDIVAETLIGYIKASNTDSRDQFGSSIALSAKGDTLAVGAPFEDGPSTGINGNQSEKSAGAAGAVYLFKRTSGGTWSQQAYLKASNTNAGDIFGVSLALSAEGNTLAVGAPRENSGTHSDQSDNSKPNAGAVYLFIQDDNGDWSQSAYLKASNPDTGDSFGTRLALSAEGGTLAVGAPFEAGATQGINGDQSNNEAEEAGAVYLFSRGNANDWSQQAYIKASNAGASDRFGTGLALSNEGNTLAVGAPQEGSGATGINGDQNDNSEPLSGAVYLFSRDDNGKWDQKTYIKASNAEASDRFGTSLALSKLGDTLAMGAFKEGSASTGINGDQRNNSKPSSGAAYIFSRDTSGNWSQQAYIKASNADLNDQFGLCLTLSAKGNILAVGAPYEQSNAMGINGDQNNNLADQSGAAYIFTRTEIGSWSQQTYVKASNTDEDDGAFIPPDLFGCAFALSAEAHTLAVGAPWEDSSASGINGNQNDNSAELSGAVYLY